MLLIWYCFLFPSFTSKLKWNHHPWSAILSQSLWILFHSLPFFFRFFKILSNSSTRNTIISIIAASQAQNYQESSTFSAFVDQRMGSSFTSEGMREFLRLITWCVNPLSERRPPMNYVEMEIDRIREKEMSLTTIMGEGTTTVTLGSQLFTTSKWIERQNFHFVFSFSWGGVLNCICDFFFPFLWWRFWLNISCSLSV